MADNVIKLRIDSQEYDSKIKRAAEQLNRYADGCRKAGSTLEHVDEGVLEFTRSLGKMETTATTARGKVSELTKAYTELAVQYKNMTDEEKKGEYGKALAASLDQLKTRIQEGKSQLDDINKSINGGGGLTGALDNMLGKVGLNVEGLMKFGGAAGAATTALKVAKDAFFASETSLDEWGRTVQSSQSLYQGFLSALNNSDISGFLSRMDEIVSAARDAYNAMDELGTFSAFQQRNVAKGRAGYAQALDEYRLNPTADNKQKLQQANQKVMNDLRESHDKTEAAYQAALRQIATERISGKGMQDAFVKMFSEGNYGDLQAAKSSYKTGRGLNSGAQYYYGDRVYDGRVQDRTTGKWRDMSDTEKQQFEFARALSQVNDSQIKEVQALGAQSVAITEQIYQQDRAYNRLSGNNAPLKSGGGSVGVGGRSGGGKTTTAPTYAAGSLAEAQAELQRLSKLWNEAGSDVRDQYLQPLIEAEAKVKSMQNAMSLQKEQAQGRLLEDKPVEIPVTASISDSFIQSVDDIREYMKDHPIVIPIENTSKDVKTLQETAKTTAQVVGTIGQAFNAIEDPAAKVAAVVAQAIANIALAYSDSLAKDQVTKSNIFAFIAAAAASTVSMASTIASIHSSTGYAEGGIVKGNSYSGDNVPAMVGGAGGQLVGLDAGEVVLTRAMQSNLAAQLQGNGMSGLSLKTKVKGTELLVWLDNSLAKSGRGELVTWAQ